MPSGLNATATTASLCIIGGPMGLPVAASQSRAVLSQLPVSTVLPSGLNATAQTDPPVHHWWPDGLAGGGVPEPRRLVVAAGEYGLAVGAECHGRDPALVRENGLEPDEMALPGRQVGPGRVLPAEVTGGDSRAPGLDHPKQPLSGLPLLERGLATLEVQGRKALVRGGQRHLQLLTQCFRVIERLFEIFRDGGDFL